MAPDIYDIRDANNRPVEIVGIKDIDILLDKAKISSKALVSKALPEDQLILGWRTMRDLGIIPMHFPHPCKQNLNCCQSKMMKIKGAPLPGGGEPQKDMPENHSSEEEENFTGGDSPDQADNQSQGEQDQGLKGRQLPVQETDQAPLPHADLQEGNSKQKDIYPQYPQRTYNNIPLTSKTYKQDIKKEV